uniref:Lipase member I n=1 Tax=Cacopsylla melanoneura TaxID=428564 RepID=A0A8D8ZH56_9HEMI
MDEMVDRITGLDPAGVLISEVFSSAQYILDPTDALFIDVHHTNNGLVAAGSPTNMGTVDIWYNYGLISFVKQIQPGCFQGLFYPVETDTCSHQRAIDYFAESINPLAPDYNEFVGKDDNGNTVHVVGEDIPRHDLSSMFHGFQFYILMKWTTSQCFRSRDLYVTTNSESPFAQDQQTVLEIPWYEY